MKREKHLLPVRKGRAKKPSDASVLLHALVIALRDGEPREKLEELTKCYPRIMNRSNPFIWLLQERERLQKLAGEKPDGQMVMAQIESELQTFQNKKPRTRGMLHRLLHPFAPTGAPGR